MKNKQELLKLIDQQIEAIADPEEKELAKERREKYLGSYDGEDRTRLSPEIAEDIANRPQEVGITTGLSELDFAMDDGGFLAGDVQAIAGATESGKTTLAQHMSLMMEQAGHVPFWLELEISDKKFLENYQKMHDAMFPDKKGELPIYSSVLTRTIPTVTLDWISDRIMEARINKNASVVFLDNLDFINEVRHGKNQVHDNISEVMTRLKQIARETETCIILLCPLTKVMASEVPEMAHLRGSSMIGHTATSVIMVYRKSIKDEDKVIYSNEAVIALQKNRNGGHHVAVKVQFNNGKYEF